jgi:DNA-binding GntR family transcriptional regulator
MKKTSPPALQLASADSAAGKKRRTLLRLPIEHPKSLASIVEERLRDAIVNAELTFGQALPESAHALGVSRTPMREALTRLEVQGLVIVVPKRGTFVFKPTVSDVKQLATFRLMLETTALEQSLQNDKEGALRALREGIQAMKTALKRKDTLAYATADSRFHEAFFAHCGNSYLVSAFRNVSGRVAALRAHLTVPRAHEQVRSFAEHEAIVAAFAAGARKEIRQTLTEHILRAKDVYAQAILEDAMPPASPTS